MTQTLYALRDAFRYYVNRYAPDIASFCGDALNADHEIKPIEPRRLCGTDAFTAKDMTSTEPLQPIVNAVRAAADDVYWRQSYTLADQGFDQHYLDNYAWFNLIAPSGPFVSNDLRLSIGYWGQGLHYPRHRHEPEEIYLTLAGSAIYISDGRAAVDGGPGTTICHYSQQPHAADFSKSPLLAAAFWRGSELEAKSRFDDPLT